MQGEVSICDRGYRADYNGPYIRGRATFRYPADALMKVGFEPCPEGPNVYQYGEDFEDDDETLDELMTRSRKRRRSGLVRVYSRKNPNPHYRRRHNENCTLVALALGAIGFLVGRASK